jgi:hypothetical protein
VLELCKNPGLEPERVIGLHLVETVAASEMKGRQSVTLKLNTKLPKTGDKVRYGLHHLAARP